MEKSTYHHMTCAGVGILQTRYNEKRPLEGREIGLQTESKNVWTDNESGKIKVNCPHFDETRKTCTRVRKALEALEIGMENFTAEEARKFASMIASLQYYKPDLYDFTRLHVLEDRCALLKTLEEEEK